MIDKNTIDINFDFRNDTICGDPDTDSLKLYDFHKHLWNKALPNGKNLETLVYGSKSSRLLIKNNLYDNLSSDRMCPHFDGKYNNKFDGWLTLSEKEDLKHVVRTIGGHILFPAHKRNGFTINQARGVSRIISDRFDLTLECIRLFYLNEQNPLNDSLLRYEDFFELFLDFKGYINFFLLQDFINKNDQVIFTIPFDGFNRSALPQNIKEYKEYSTKTIEIINKRNKRILENI